jgi:AcrR family transcriptional regulator
MVAMGGFQRARSPEQVAERRAAVLATAEEMLAELPVSAITLNELSRRVGLAKSNVLRYFESREAVLLALLTRESQIVLDELAAELVMFPAVDVPVTDRCEQLAATITAALARHPKLCDLNSNSAAVLERNISVGTAAEFKRSAIDTTRRFAELVRQYVPELGPEAAFRFVATAITFSGALWSHVNPPPAVEEVYASHPELTVMRVEFGPTLCETLATMLAGLIARPPR